MPKTDETLARVLDAAFRFHYNVGTSRVLDAVYGPKADTNEAYWESKSEQIRLRGFGSWYCDLDLENRRTVARMMLDRYPELSGLLKTPIQLVNIVGEITTWKAGDATEMDLIHFLISRGGEA